MVQQQQQQMDYNELDEYNWNDVVIVYLGSLVKSNVQLKEVEDQVGKMEVVETGRGRNEGNERLDEASRVKEYLVMTIEQMVYLLMMQVMVESLIVVVVVIAVNVMNDVNVMVLIVIVVKWMKKVVKNWMKMMKVVVVV